MEPPRTLLVKLPIDYTYGRSILSGILGQMHQMRGWRLRLVRTDAELAAVLKQRHNFTAAAGMFWDAATVRKLRKRCATVLTFARRPRVIGDIAILLDDAAIGAAAAKAFLNTGYQRFAVFQPDAHQHSALRRRGFITTLRAAGCSSAISRLASPQDVLPLIRKSPDPLAVFAVNDVHARALVDYCEAQRITIPHQLAVIGADDDEIFVHLGATRLSSVQLPFKQMGARALQCLVEAGRYPAKHTECLPPLGVMHRETTATSAQLPPVLRKFLDNLQRMRPLPASVAAACRAWHLPRRSLELACRSSSQPSPGALLNHARRQLTQRLLRQGYSPLEIAAEAGFRQTRSLRLKNRPQ